VLQAHNHNYEISKPIKYNNANPSAPIVTVTNNNHPYYFNHEGQIFGTVGTAGANLYEFSLRVPYMYTQYVGHGFLNIDVIDNGQTFNATFYSNDGSVRDQFNITKGNSAAAAEIEELQSVEDI
jgi:hypothetical protein